MIDNWNELIPPIATLHCTAVIFLLFFNFYFLSSCRHIIIYYYEQWNQYSTEVNFENVYNNNNKSNPIEIVFFLVNRLYLMNDASRIGRVWKDKRKKKKNKNSTKKKIEKRRLMLLEQKKNTKYIKYRWIELHTHFSNQIDYHASVYTLFAYISGNHIPIPILTQNLFFIILIYIIVVILLLPSLLLATNAFWYLSAVHFVFFLPFFFLSLFVWFSLSLFLRLLNNSKEIKKAAKHSLIAF